MVLVIVVIILAIAATMLIGEATFQRVRLANIADGALITVASKFCQGLNQIKAIHTRMFLNYIQLQTTLLTSGNCGMAFCTKLDGYARTLGYNLMGIQSNYSLYKQAQEVAKNATKNLRSSLYDVSFGGALVDEPKPFEPDEVLPGGGLNYEKYANRPSNFTTTFLAFKTAHKDDWFKNNQLSYSFNKSVAAFLNKQGVLTSGAPDASYESYLSVTLQGIPAQVRVRPQRMVVVFLYCQPCTPGVPCCFWPGFVPHPWAWINNVDMGSGNFGMSVQKKLAFRRLPFFGRDIHLSHNNSARIKGSVWSSYDFALTQ